MKLYHFTDPIAALSVEREGITKGVVWLVTLPGLQFKENIQWLTDDPRPYEQGWATNRSGACPDRTAVRFEVVIPKSARHSLHRWLEYSRNILQWDLQTIEEFNAAGGSDGSNWWVFEGRIPPGWLRECAISACIMAARD